MSDKLTVLVAKAKNAHLDVEIAHDNALEHAMKAGDFLLEILRLSLVPHGQRKTLYAETCGSKSTGEVYTRLASNRALLEERRQSHGTAVQLSTRAALRIIDKGDSTPKRSRTSKPEAAAKVAEAKATKPEKSLPD